MLKSLILLSTFAAAYGRLVLDVDTTSRSLKEKPTASSVSWCESPIPKGRVEFPEQMIGRAEINFDMYSGYVNVTEHDFLYYWLTGTADKNPEAPLIIWTNGGPGKLCLSGSSIM